MVYEPLNDFGGGFLGIYCVVRGRDLFCLFLQMAEKSTASARGGLVSVDVDMTAVVSK